MCEIAHDPDLFRDAPQIRKRHVLWGSGPATFDHSSAIVEEQTFLNRLWTDFPSTNNPPDWTIRAASDSDRVTHLGTRTARIAKVESRDAQEACWIEALPEGWLFLIPDSIRRKNYSHRAA